MTSAEAGSPMPIACWTIIHRAASGLAKTAHPLRHFVRRGVHRVAHSASHAVVRPARTWTQLACKVLPAAFAGGGLLAPVTANAPPAPQPSAHYMEPMPVFSPWSGFGETGLMQVQLPEPPLATAPSMPEIASALPPLPPESSDPGTPYLPPMPGSPSDPSSPGPSVPEPGSFAILLGAVTILLSVRQLAAASQARARRS